MCVFVRACVRACTRAQGFDEYMNLVLDDAEEVNSKKNTRKKLGRCMLKGENITLMQEATPGSGGD